MNELELVFYIVPQPHQSFRFAKNGRKYKPKKIVQYQDYIKRLTKDQLPDGWTPIPSGSSIIVEYVEYSYAYLKSTAKKYRTGKIPKTTKPDLQDNLNKALFDALEGIVYEQDQNIVEIKSMKKYYSDKNYIKMKICY